MFVVNKCTPAITVVKPFWNITAFKTLKPFPKQVPNETMSASSFQVSTTQTGNLVAKQTRQFGRGNEWKWAIVYTGEQMSWGSPGNWGGWKRGYNRTGESLNLNSGVGKWQEKKNTGNRTKSWRNEKRKNFSTFIWRKTSSWQNSVKFWSGNCFRTNIVKWLWRAFSALVLTSPFL